MVTGYEEQFFRDIHQIKLSLGEINQVLQGIQKSFRYISKEPESKI